MRGKQRESEREGKQPRQSPILVASNRNQNGCAGFHGLLFDAGHRGRCGREDPIAFHVPIGRMGSVSSFLFACGVTGSLGKLHVAASACGSTEIAIDHAGTSPFGCRNATRLDAFAPTLIFMFENRIIAKAEQSLRSAWLIQETALIWEVFEVRKRTGAIPGPMF